MLRLIYFFLFSEYAVLKGNEEKFSMRTKICALVSFENRKAGKPMVDADILTILQQGWKPLHYISLFHLCFILRIWLQMCYIFRFPQVSQVTYWYGLVSVMFLHLLPKNYWVKLNQIWCLDSVPPTLHPPPHTHLRSH